MRITAFTPMWRERPAGGFTLIELLVVVAVITILASITMPVLLKAFGTGQTAKCLSNIGQITRAAISYTQANGQRLVSGGDRSNVHAWNKNAKRNTDAGPVYDGPWDYRHYREERLFPFWYEALQPYTSPGTSMKEAAESYNERHGTNISVDTTDRSDRDKIRNELARLCRIYTCPAKKAAPVGYGYNYAAVYGVSGMYKWTSSDEGEHDWTSPDQESSTGGNPFFRDYRWRCWNPNGRVLEYRPAPIMRHHDEWSLLVHQAIPVLWYGQSIPASALRSPSKTIAFCDAGDVTNDPDPVNDPVPPDEWEEHSRSNVTGYVRFPIDTGPDVYAHHYINSAEYNSASGKRWRPVPRHKGKTVIGNFDGSARLVAIEDIVAYPYGHPKCLYSNHAEDQPPLSPNQ